MMATVQVGNFNGGSEIDGEMLENEWFLIMFMYTYDG